MDGLKLLFRKSKTKSHRILLKTICNATESSCNLIYINIYLTNCTQNFTKQQLLLAALPKKNKTFCSTVGGWYKELKLKDFRVFGFIELLFNGMLQNNTFKKRILQITKLKYTCLKCLCRSNVFEYYRKICKRKQPFTVAINKNLEFT